MIRDIADIQEVSGERRLLTAIYCDLVDSTKLAAELGTDELFELIEAYYDLCQQVVRELGGTIYQFAGDGVVAVFGYADAHDASALRAVTASVQISERVRELERQLNLKLQTRIGVSTGEVVVGHDSSSDSKPQMTITGAAVFMAARIQGEADIGSVGLSESTYRVVAEEFPVHGPRYVSLKGFGESIPIWTVDVSNSRLPTPAEDAQAVPDGAPVIAVGREKELEFLRNKWRMVESGDKQVTLVKGPPGIGKSFLLNAFASEASKSAVGTVLLRGSPIYAHSPLYPVREFLLRQISARSGTNTRDIRKGLAAFSRSALDGTEHQALTEFITGEENPEGPLAPKERMSKIHSALSKLISFRAKDGPLLVIADDIHWIDAATNDVLLQIAESGESAPLMILLGCRDSESLKLESWKSADAIELTTLGWQESIEILRTLDVDSALDAKAQEKLVERSEGMPLFLVELAKFILEGLRGHQRKGSTASALRIPVTLHESLQARLDTVDTPTRLLLQAASTLGGPFEPSLLSEVLKVPQEQVDHGLAIAAEAGLLQATEKAGSYAFQHALIRDVAYGSQIRRARIALHDRVATVLADGERSLLDASPEVVAHHLTEAGRSDKAAPLWYRAASLALNRGAPKDAAILFSKGLSTLGEKFEENQALRKLAFGMHLGHGQASYVASGPAAEETVKAFRSALSLIDTIEDLDHQCQVIYGIFAGFHFSSQLDAAKDPAERMLELATQQYHAGYLCQAHRMLGYVNFFLADFPEMDRHIDRILALYDRETAPSMMTRFGADCLNASLGFRAVSLALSGKRSAAIELLSTNLEAARTLGHPATIGWAYASSIYAHCFLGNFEEVLDLAEVAIPYCEENDVAAWGAHSRYLRIWSKSKLNGVGSDTSAELAEAMQVATTGLLLGAPLFRSLRAETLRRSGKLVDASEEARAAYEFCHRSGQRVFEPAASRVLADCLDLEGGDGYEYRKMSDAMCDQIGVQVDYVAM